MNFTIRFFSLAILFTYLLTIPSCKKDDLSFDNVDTSGIETIDPNATVLEIIKDGVCNFSVKSPSEKEKQYVFGAVESAVEIINEKLGTNIQATSDQTNTYEIVFGSQGELFQKYTDKKYRSRDYFLGVDGTKFLVYAKSEEAMLDAVRDFKKMITEKAEKDSKNVNLISTENKECIFKDIKIGDASLNEFSILYSQGYTYSEELLAYKLRVFLTRATGTRCEVYNEKEKVPNTSNLIVIGNTSLGKTPECKENDYGIEFNEGKIFLYSNSIEGYNSLFSVFPSRLTECCESIRSSASESDFSALKTNKSSDVRIYIQNIYGHNPESRPLSYRVRIITELLSSYKPDILGFQEYSPLVRSATFNFTAYLLTYGYKEVPVKATNEKKSNYTPLFYNPDTLKIIDKGYDYFEGELNDSGSKTITWAIFEHIKTGQRFGACSTHFFWQTNAAAGRIENAKDLSKRCKEMADKYNCPIVAGGDLNTAYNSDPIRTLKQNGFTHIYDIAENKNNVCSHHAYPEFSKDLGYYSTISVPKNDYTSSIDHVLAYNDENLSFENYYVVTEEFALMSSDHCPIIVDFSFKNKT